MAVTKKDKLEAKLAKAKERRIEVKAEIAKLEKEEKGLAAVIRETMETLGLDKTGTVPGKDYYLQRPQKTVYHEDRIYDYLKSKAPKIVSKVFKKVRVFDKEAFQLMADAGKIPDVDSILADDEYVEMEAMTPRLMPVQEPKKEK